ncbi:Ribonuclease H [Salinisphaera dokdonensis CL-ES53]|uniref:Ribonuclease HII n=1 Tax=Salinisphaera dokdonensis CL-ES53 TaxID=1304272 RepID=A0ABV2B3E0_9GAMM
MTRRKKTTRFACPFIAGVDEVGRGPLAGPVVAAAVILPPRPLPRGLTDSKALNAADRERLDEKIRARALAYAIAEASPAEIDQFNILQASLLAMQRAVQALWLRPGAAWVDGNQPPPLGVPLRTIIGGDGSVPAISAASIIAKVERDRQMVAFDDQYPGYGFAQHKGYGTAVHRAALAAQGITPIHRRSFAPVARAAGPSQMDFDDLMR